MKNWVYLLFADEPTNEFFFQVGSRINKKKDCNIVWIITTGIEAQLNHRIDMTTEFTIIVSQLEQTVRLV